jgi:hypothetical protein
MQSKHNPLILSIDLRPQRFGYAIFEGPRRLIDWGACFYPPGGKQGAVVAGRKVAGLIKVFVPSVIVVKKVLHKSRNSEGVQPILRAIRREASIQSIPVCFVSRTDVRQAFRIFGGETKYEIACVLTGIFHELLWRLPPARTFYKGEHPAMSIFDAVSLGFTYWQLSGTEIPPPE